MKKSLHNNIIENAAYFPALTGVRALAAYLIFITHLPVTSQSMPLIPFYFIKGSYVGVSVFFVLSGFLISYRYAEALNRTVSFKTYFLRRAARIYPLYLVLTILTLIWLRDFSIWHWFLNLSFLKGFFKVEVGTGIPQAWSLSVEETFYLTAPLLFWSFRKTGLLTIVLMLLCGIIIVLLAAQSGLSSFMADAEFMMQTTLFGRCFEFFCGYFLALLIKNKNEDTKQTGLIFTLSGSILIVISIIFLGYLTQNEVFTDLFLPLNLLLQNFFFPVFVAWLFFGIIREKSWFSQLLSSKLFQISGKSSYAFYLIHAGLFWEVIHFHLTTSNVAKFVILYILAIAIYYLFEEPVNQYLRRKSDSWALRKKLKQQPDFLKQKA